MFVSALYENESASKTKRRQQMMSSCFDLVIKNGIKNLTVEKLMQEILFDHRTFYNYYESMHALLEDIMISSMRLVYDFKSYEFHNEMNIKDFFHSLGEQFINHCYLVKDHIKFIDDYDHFFTTSYYSETYDQIIKEIYHYPVVAFQSSKTIAIIFEAYDVQEIFQNIQLFISTIFVYISRLIRREKIYTNNLTFLSRDGLDQLKNALCVAIGHSIKPKN